MMKNNKTDFEIEKEEATIDKQVLASLQRLATGGYITMHVYTESNHLDGEMEDIKTTVSVGFDGVEAVSN